MSIKRDVALPIIGIVITGLVLTSILTISKSRNLVIFEATTVTMHAYRDTVLNALTTLMISGTITKYETSFLDQMRNIADVRIVRAAAVDKDYGKGAFAEYPKDEIEREVIEKGKEKIVLEGVFLRGIFPYIARSNSMGKNCLSCHRVADGTVLGAVSIRMPLTESFSHLRSARNFYFGIGLIGIMIVSGLIILSVNATVNALAKEMAERKLTEESLRQSRQEQEKVLAQLEAILNSLAEGLLVSDMEGNLIRWNPFTVSMHGFDSMEQCPRRLLEFAEVFELSTVQDGVLPLEHWPLSRILRGETLHGWEVKIRRYGTDWQHFFTYRGTLARDKSGTPFLAVVTIQDITERKRTENERQLLLSELARSNKELEQFAYAASHDLREPLRTVVSFLHLLEQKYRDKLDSKAGEYINIAVGGANRMQKLIEGLLAYSRIALRGAKFGPVNGNGVFEKALSNLSVAVQESNARITKYELPVVLGDENQLIQLFQNLVGNAIKFRKPDISPEIHVSAKREGHEWVFSFRDNGIGIGLEHFERIFLIFQRLHTQDEYPGTGMGLALCKQIVDRHQGRIWVESAPNEGATFLFTLPEVMQNEA